MEKEKTITEDEPVAEFKIISDRDLISIVSEKVNEVMVEISGYDLNLNINMKYINSIEDVEDAVNGIGDLFRREIMSKLIDQKKQNN